MSSQPTESSLESLTPPSEPSTAIETPQKRRLYCLTICVRRRPTLSEEEYEAYLRKHAQISKDLLAKYGVIRWSYCYNTPETRKHLPNVYGPQFDNFSDYDCFSQCTVEHPDDLVRMKEDPYYKEMIQMDPRAFADVKNTKITMGWYEEYISDGKAVESTAKETYQ